MRKLLQINTCLHRGGTGGVIEKVGRVVQQHGWDSYIAYSRNLIENTAVPSTSKLVKIGDKYDLWMHALWSRLFDIQGLCSSNATKRLLNRITELQPDIIQLHNIHGYYLNYPILFNFLREYGRPVVWTFHDCWPITGHCSHFENIGCQKWKTGCYDCPLKKEYPTSWFFDNSKKQYSLKNTCFKQIKNLTIVPVSSWLDNIISNSFLGCFPRKIIRNGIDINLFSPASNRDEIRQKLGWYNKTVLIGVSNVWVNTKGYDDYIKLSSSIDDDTIICLVGLNENQMEGLPRNIIGIKRTSNIQELVDLYSASDLFCNFTYMDSFPTTNLEALSCGIPVFTYRTGGSPEAVDDKTGFVADKGCYLKVLDVIEKIKSAEDWQKMSSSCRKRAVTLFNKEERFEDYYRLYNNLL